jgi:hypothetical protein
VRTVSSSSTIAIKGRPFFIDFRLVAMRHQPALL